ncbi:efflux RND transporter periplasmic adaptor subunit [Persicobacter diffluens]|uniref:MexH family multidrug efflux RND transporter periplasmic adaptor subunit n=1 Tax=Persicobacter diffluens TaxID=981 RepID=A0AAN4VVH6_9BACT|nr:MexH family multidrug efflux RND transporter periplasmic adaptor subunit [Persicobacter diffluens]
MKKRIISLSLAAGVLVLAFGIFTLMPSRRMEAKILDEGQSALLVEVMNAQVGTISQTVSATGRLKAVDRYEIFAQVDGQLKASARNFREGKLYRKGQLMLEIDRREFEMSLLAQKSDFITQVTAVLPDLKVDYPAAYPLWKAYLQKVDVHRSLPALPESQSEQEQFFLTGKGIYTSFYNVKSGEEKLSKYSIYAPFNGVVTSADAEAGTAVRTGTVMGTFISSDQFELEVTVPMHYLHQIKLGKEAQLSSTELKGAWKGKVVRIGGAIDQQSQSVKVFIQTSGKDLKEGMFLKAEMQSKPFENAVSVPRKMLNAEGKVFVVKNGRLQLQAVEVLAKEGDMVVVSGLSAGTPLLKTVIKSAYEGMKVSVKQ